MCRSSQMRCAWTNRRRCGQLCQITVLDHFQKGFSGKISTCLFLQNVAYKGVLTNKQRDLLPKRAWEASWLGGVDGRPGAMLAAVVRLLRKSRRAAEDEGSRRKRNRVLLAACGFACLLLMQLALEEPERRQDLTSMMNICLWMHETRSGAADFARGLGYRVSARSAVISADRGGGDPDGPVRAGTWSMARNIMSLHALSHQA